MKPTRFNAIIRKDDICYVAECVGNSVVSQGNTIEETINNLKEALELHYEDESISIEIKPFFVETEGDGTYRPRLPPWSYKKSWSEKGREEMFDQIMYTLCIDFHKWLLKIPVLGHIYALILLAFFLYMCSETLRFFLNGEFLLAFVGTLGLVFTIWIVCLARKWRG
jgi:predicted RNase H-like HicB family nuclease